MSKKHTEDRLEDAIEHYLITHHGYEKDESGDYDVAQAIEPLRVIRFLKDTQAKRNMGTGERHRYS